jgi:hypothetical protein
MFPLYIFIFLSLIIHLTIINFEIMTIKIIVSHFYYLLINIEKLLLMELYFVLLNYFIELIIKYSQIINAQHFNFKSESSLFLL